MLGRLRPSSRRSKRRILRLFLAKMRPQRILRISSAYANAMAFPHRHLG